MIIVSRRYVSSLIDVFLINKLGVFTFLYRCLSIDGKSHQMMKEIMWKLWGGMATELLQFGKPQAILSCV